MSDSSKEIRERALGFLARREHSRRQLQRKLAERDYADHDITPVLDGLEAENLISDHRFTESFVHSRRQRGYGPLRIQMELHEHGVADAIVSEYLDFQDPLWREQVKAVRQKKYGEELPKEYQARAKQMKFLQYRGFTADQIRYALDAEWD